MTHVVARGARWSLAAAVWAAIALVVGLGAAVTLPSLFGMKSLTVLSGSMEPTLDTGGMVVDETIPASDARPGDIITFNDPEDQERLITHRLRSIRIEGPKAYMVTRGDANDTSERWNVALDSEIGRVAYHIPMLGYLREWTGGQSLRLGLLAIVAGLGLWMLIDIWRPRRDEEADRAGHSTPAA